MPSFPHLNLRLKVTGTPNPKKMGGGATPNPITQKNLENRPDHADDLRDKYAKQDAFWKIFIENRKSENKPDLPNPEVIPVLLTVDPKTFDIESLKRFNIEIIAEEENGLIIGASTDSFVSLATKINNFVQEKPKSNGIAKLWNIEDGIQWKLEHIVAESLSKRWNTIDEDDLVVDISIACYMKFSNRPKQTKKQTAEQYEKSLKNWEKKRQDNQIVLSDKESERQDSFDAFLKSCGGERIDSFINLNDSFGSRVQIKGAALKDLVLSYQYIFDVTEAEIETELTNDTNLQSEPNDLELLPPNINAPKICVIDSGIQEGHKLLSPAIQTEASFCFLPSQPSNTADEVGGGGHGTRVAGSILYPRFIPESGRYQLPFWIQNARILDKDCKLPLNVFPPALMKAVVERYPTTMLFNLSVNAATPYRPVHMSAWAAQLDWLSFNKNILFIVSTGNVFRENTSNHIFPAITNFYKREIQYPDYLYERLSQVSNPAQSAFALTVGSVCIDTFEDDDRESFGSRDEASAFTKTGPGIWGMIKPDVVEYGGDLVKQKVGSLNLTEQMATSPELVKKGGFASRDSVGTSYAAPRVAHIAAMIQTVLPNENALLYRALVVQSARLPFDWFKNPTFKNLQTHGYGIPDADRAIDNTPQRITFITSNDIKPQTAHIYSIAIPKELSNPGDSYDVLIEITLSYFAEPRRTRRTTRSYLSARADWESSKINEPFGIFKDRISMSFS